MEVKGKGCIAIAGGSTHGATTFPPVLAGGRAMALCRCKLASKCARDNLVSG